MLIHIKSTNAISELRSKLKEKQFAWNPNFCCRTQVRSQSENRMTLLVKIVY